jgi:hypothetical protein
MHFSKCVAKIQSMNAFQEQQQDHFHFIIVKADLKTLPIQELLE